MFRYVEAPDFEILLIAYSFDGGPVQVFDLSGFSPYVCPKAFMQALTDPAIKKTAHNAAFEITCLSKYFGINLDPAQWECTMAKSALCGLPLPLDQVAKALNLTAQKDASGKALIKYFTLPCKPTAANGQRTRNLPQHDLEKWNRFIEYNRQDVVVEQQIRKALSYYKFPEREQMIWALDYKINARGVQMDPVLIKNAIRFDARLREELIQEAIELTGLENPNSVAQMKGWLESETGEEIEKLNKDALPELLKSAKTEQVRRVIEIRGQLGKTSVKKYNAMAAAICADGRLRGMHQYGGAMRTMRWAGRIVQPQNLPQNKMKDLDFARNIVLSGDYELAKLIYGDDVSKVLSELIRTAFVASEGRALIPADFKQIEARVIAWLAGEKWRMDTFLQGHDIYVASAAQMFKVPMDSIKGKDEQGNEVKGPNFPLRAKGKIAELALGFQGGQNALIAMGALKMGLMEEELPALVSAWRNANKKVVNLWYKMQDAAIECLETGKPVDVVKGIVFKYRHGNLWMRLPSGRYLCYYKAKLVPGKFGGNAIRYLGVNDKKQWGWLDTYGGKLVENAVQATARDILAEALLRLDRAGYDIVMHVHDEAITDVDPLLGDRQDIEQIMARPIEWAEGLPLGADAYETAYYKKDD